jgi:D-alanine-D-alanine ligase
MPDGNRQTVVYAADVFDEGAQDSPFERRSDLEKTDAETIAQVLAALEEGGFTALHIGDLDQLARHALAHPDDIVLSTYGGDGSRSRTALVAGLSESLRVPYVGLDAFGQALCHDKSLTKTLALECGLTTPAWRVFRPGWPLDLLEEFELPFILKPVAEGSSIGISAANVIRDRSQALAVAQDLLRTFEAPIMAEAFVAGREVSLCAIQAEGGARTAFSEIVVAGQPDYFVDRVWDAAEKYHRRLDRHVALVDNELADIDRQAIMRLLSALGDFGWIRIDGRLANGRFHFIEASPDAHLGMRSQFAQGFIQQGMSYAQVLAAVVASANQRLPGRAAIG